MILAPISTVHLRHRQPLPNMRLNEFTSVLCDDAKRFFVEWQRSAADHGGLFADMEDQNYDEWLRAFVLWARQEEKARRRGLRSKT
jgi:hypothetical protein